MKPPINLSVNLTYYCNFKCGFCYLTPEQLRDRKRLPLDILEQKLDEVMAEYEIHHVDLYGGEVMVLPKEYLFQVRDVLHARGIDDIVLVTNGSVTNEVTSCLDFDLTVSYDLTARERADWVLGNLFMLDRPYTVLTLASRTFLDTVSVDDYVNEMNLLNQMKCAEIKPYSSNQANQHSVSYKEFEDFVWAVIQHPERNFYFENRTLVKEAVEGQRNAYSDDHLYITPTGDFAVLEFDDQDHEFFLKMDSLDDYRAWCVKERLRVEGNLFCGACPYKGGCLSEHLRDVKSLDNSCNGFRGLLDRWAEHASTTPSKA
ncbi:molybdenum cofactor biosynthesis protein A [compost metagenome]